MTNPKSTFNQPNGFRADIDEIARMAARWGTLKSLSTFHSQCIIDFGDVKDSLYFGKERGELLRKQRIVLGGLDESAATSPLRDIPAHCVHQPQGFLAEGFGLARDLSHVAAFGCSRDHHTDVDHVLPPALPLTYELQADWYNSLSVNANSRCRSS